MSKGRKSLRKRHVSKSRRSLRRRFLLASVMIGALAVAVIHSRDTKRRHHRTEETRTATTQTTSSVSGRPGIYEGTRRLSKIEKYRDPSFSGFRRELFSKEHATFDIAKKMIEKRTGTPIGERSFSLPDPFGLTRTKKFYTINLGKERFPEGFKKIFGVNKFFTYSVERFDTRLKGGDGRISALAQYVLSKYDCKSPEEAVLAMSGWVMANMPLDKDNALAAISPMDIDGSKENMRDRGFGTTHNHLNSIDFIRKFSGLCFDFTNLISDLLNSVGIPARTVSVVSRGLATSAYEGDSLKRMRKKILHTLLQVNLPKGPKYLEVSPAGNGDDEIEIVDSPPHYIRDRLVKRYPGILVYMVSCFGALPEERFMEDPVVKNILDKGLKGGNDFIGKVLSDSQLYSKFLGKLFGNKDYVICHHDRIDDLDLGFVK